MIRKAIIKGQPKTKRPWKMIFIFCEGIYSMEGNIVNLPKLIEIKNKYKVFILFFNFIRFIFFLTKLIVLVQLVLMVEALLIILIAIQMILTF